MFYPQILGISYEVTLPHTICYVLDFYIFGSVKGLLVTCGILIKLSLSHLTNKHSCLNLPHAFMCIHKYCTYLLSNTIGPIFY